MTKSGMITDYVRANPGRSAQHIADTVNIDLKFVQTICGQKTRQGKFVKDTDGAYSINEGGGKPAKKKPKAKHGKLKGFRALRRSLEKKPKAAPVVAGPSPLQVHVRSTLAVLQAVMDIDNADPMVGAAFRSHCEAVELAVPGNNA